MRHYVKSSLPHFNFLVPFFPRPSLPSSSSSSSSTPLEFFVSGDFSFSFAVSSPDRLPFLLPPSSASGCLGLCRRPFEEVFGQREGLGAARHRPGVRSSFSTAFRSLLVLLISCSLPPPPPPPPPPPSPPRLKKRIKKDSDTSYLVRSSRRRSRLEARALAGATWLLGRRAGGGEASEVSEDRSFGVFQDDPGTSEMRTPPGTSLRGQAGNLQDDLVASSEVNARNPKDDLRSPFRSQRSLPAEASSRTSSARDRPGNPPSRTSSTAFHLLWASRTCLSLHDKRLRRFSFLITLVILTGKAATSVYIYFLVLYHT